MSDSNESKTAAIHEDLVAAIPYAAYLDLRIEQADEAQARVYRMPYRDELIGSPRLPALHGGTVASLLELAMQFEVLIAEAQTRIPYPVDFSIDYWRSAAAADCLCRCRLIRSGRRIAQVQAECWQDDPDRPIAFARADFLLRAVEGDNPAE
jgi:uncharacterized protein (TIGR00369 family)